MKNLISYSLIFSFYGLLTLGLFWQQTPLPKQKTQTTHPQKSYNTYVIKFKKIPVPQKISAILNSKGVFDFRPLYKGQDLKFKKIYQLVLESSTDPEKIKKQDHFEYFELSAVVKTMSLKLPTSQICPSTTQDFYSSYQWALWNNGQTIQWDSYPNAPIWSSYTNGDSPCGAGQKSSTSGNVYDIGWHNIYPEFEKKMKKDVIVAVLDHGVNYAHPDLTHNIYRTQNECSENGYPPHFTSKVQAERSGKTPTPDNDGNGYPGDCMGWNFAIPPEQSKTFPDGNNNVDDLNGHGTHVAGVMAAEIGNNEGVSGLSNKIKILPIRVIHPADEKKASQQPGELQRYFNGITAHVVQGIYYAVDQGAKVINLSLGWPHGAQNEHVREALDYAKTHNVLVVAAAGNDSHNSAIYPCALKNVLCVGATTINGDFAPFTNFGGHVDLLAPGDHILSTLPLATDPNSGLLNFSDKAYTLMNGTSQSAPYVSGTAAILFEYLRSSDPNAQEPSVDEVIARLMNTALPISSKSKTTEPYYTQNGLIQLDKALMASPQPVIRPVFKEIETLIVKNKTFTLPVTIKNYWQNTHQPISIQVESLNPNIHFKPNQWIINGLSVSEKTKAETKKITGRVKNSYQDSTLQYVVHVLVGDSPKRSYPHKAYLTTDLIDQKSRQILALEAPDSVLEFVKKEFENSSRPLLPVTDESTTPSQKDYYLSEVHFDEENPLNTHTMVHFFSHISGKLKYRDSIKIPYSVKTDYVIKRDFNHDQKLDYLIHSIAPVTEPLKKILGVNQDQTGFPIYTFLNSQLKPLYNTLNIHKKIEAVILNANSFATLPYKNSVTSILGPTFSTIFFIEDSFAPDADKQTDPTEDTTNPIGSHLYFLDVALDKNSQPYLLERQFTIAEIQSEIRKKIIDLGGPTAAWRWDYQIKLERLLKQTPTDLQKGQIKVLMSFYKGTDKEFYILSINQSQLKNRVNLIQPNKKVSPPFKEDLFFTLQKADYLEQDLSIQHPTLAQQVLNLPSNIYDLTNNQMSQNQYSGFTHMARGGREQRTAIIDNDRPQDLDYLYQTQVQKEDFIDAYTNLEATYRLDHQYYNFLVSRNGILSQNIDLASGQIRESIYPLIVNTFLGQFEFVIQYYPMAYKYKGQLLPALYFNTNNISAPRVFTLVSGPSGWYSPVQWNIEIHSNCKALTPFYDHQKQNYYYQLFCRKSENQFEMNWVPLQED